MAGNVANQVLTTQEFLDEIYEVKNPYTELLYKYFGSTYAFWDETAMALLIDPSLANSTSTGELQFASENGYIIKLMRASLC
jgi:inosine-uridine nucleoside N-ribohydrolase